MIVCILILLEERQNSQSLYFKFESNTMARLFSLFSTFLLLSLSTSLAVNAQAGTDCSDPFIVNTYSYSGSSLTTCGFGNDYDSNIFGLDNVEDYCYPSSGIGPGQTERNSYGGEDYVIEFTPPAGACHTISLTSSTSYASIHVLRGCPDDVNTECVGYDASSGTNPTVNFGSITGETYYIVIDNWPSPACYTFSIDISSSTTPGIANDFCSTALPLTGSGSNIGATCEPNEWSPDWPDTNPSICSGINVWQSNENGVWYTFNNPIAQNLDIEVANITCSGGNNKLQFGVWTNTGTCDLDAETLMGCTIAIGNATLTLNNLAPGNYYLFADGDAGSGCTWDFISEIISECTSPPILIGN